ncbi:MAG TPA: hypothetical protein VGM63_00905 [Mucilaginibacter sp.]|jgi:hypothetical protein
MSKTHITENDDLDAQLDQYMATKKIKPVVTSAGDGIDLFGSTEKKKPLLQRLLASLQAFLRLPKLT